MYEFLKEKTVLIPVVLDFDDEVVATVAVDDDCADLVKLRWHPDAHERDNPYTVMDLCGTMVHVHLNDVLMARHLGVPVVSGRTRLGGRCPNTGVTPIKPKRLGAATATAQMDAGTWRSAGQHGE